MRIRAMKLNHMAHVSSTTLSRSYKVIESHFPFAKNFRKLQILQEQSHGYDRQG